MQSGVTEPSKSPAIVIRTAIPADLPDVAKLLNARDGQVRDPQTVAAYLWGLDPGRTCTWLAYADEQPIGITMLYLRDMHWPRWDQTDDRSQTLRAGYWAHLFVEPEFRKQMVYPQLVLAMLRGFKAAKLDLIFTATRQPTVAEGHQKLGFALVGTPPLRLRPLRPFRLVAKHKQLGLLVPLCRPLDTMARLFLKRSANANSQVQDVGIDDSLIEQIVELMNQKSPQGVRQAWDSEQFRNRFRTTLDGTAYRIRAISRGGQIVAAGVSTLVERGNQIRAGILLSLVATASASTQEVQTLLADAEAIAHGAGAELMLSLDHTLALPQLANSSGKYFTNRSEQYHMLVYPKQLAQSPYLAADLQRWAFEYADHDAF